VWRWEAEAGGHTPGRNSMMRFLMQPDEKLDRIWRLLEDDDEKEDR
jgi:hypothetical protein